MEDLVNVLLAKYDQEKSQARKHEELRSNTTNFIIAISAGVLAFVQKNETGYVMAASGAFLIALGAFGALLSRKHYERFRYHSRFARGYDKQLGQVVAGSQLANYKKMRDTQRERFPYSYDWSLNWLWIAIHLFVSVIGGFLLFPSLIAYING